MVLDTLLYVLSTLQPVPASTNQSELDKTHNGAGTHMKNIMAAPKPPADSEPVSEDDSDPGPQPAEDDEPEYDPDEEEGVYATTAFPITHELPMKDHTKVVSALALDPSGARVVSGSHDYDCKLWDFGGMGAQVKPFRTWEPAGTYYVRFYARQSSMISLRNSQVHDLKFSNDGSQFLVISGTTQPKIFDRDGQEK